MSNKKLIVIVLAAFLIGGYVGWLVGGNQSGPSDSVAGVTNLDALTLDNGNLTVSNGTFSVSGAATFDGGIVQSSALATSTNGNATTLAESDLQGYNSILYTPNVSDVTLTLPASSTLDTFIPNAGDRVSIAIVNATTTTGIDITLAGGSGTLLRSATTTKTILSNSIGILDFVRKSNTDVEVYFNNGTNF